MKPSIEDVALRAGVSRQTVSRVINGRNWVSPETRARVLTAIDQLGYHRNTLASALRSGQTKVLGLLVSDVLNPIFAREARGVQDVADAEGYQVIFGNTDEDVWKEARLLEMLREKQVDGIIIIPCGSESREALKQVQAEQKAVVLINRCLPDFDSVGFDAHTSSCQAIQHLIDQGHRRIAILTVPHRSATAQERIRAYSETLERNGIPVDKGLVRCAAGFHDEDGQRATLELLRMGDPPTAIFTSSSQLTLGTLVAIREAGLRIPQDVAVIGCNEGQWSRVVDPPLTMVLTDGYALGRSGAELLLRRIRGDQEGMPVQVRMPAKLDIRKSSGPHSRRAVPPVVARTESESSDSYIMEIEELHWLIDKI